MQTLSPDRFNDYDLPAIIDAVQYSFNWKGVAELTSLPNQELSANILNYCLENLPDLATQDLPQLARSLSEFAPELSLSQSQKLATRLKRALDLPPGPRSAAEIEPGDLLLLDTYRTIVYAKNHENLFLIGKDNSGQNNRFKLPIEGAQVLFQNGELKISRPFSDTLSDQIGLAVPIVRYDQLLVGDVLHFRDGRRSEVVFKEEKKIVLLTRFPENNRVALEEEAQSSELLPASVVRHDFSSTFSDLKPSVELTQRCALRSARPFSIGSGNTYAGEILKDLKEHLAEYLYPVSNELATSWLAIETAHNGDKPCTHLDLRLARLLLKVEEFHIEVEKLNALSQTLSEHLSVLKFEPKLRTTDLPDSSSLPNLNYEQLMQLERRQLFRQFGLCIEANALVFKQTLSPDKQGPISELYSSISAQMVKLEDALDAVEQQAAASFLTSHLLQERAALEQITPTHSIHCETNPNEALCKRLSEIAQSYRYTKEEKEDALPQHPERFDLGITIADSPPEKFAQAFKAGAELIVAKQNGQVDGFLLYFPPEVITPQMREAFKIETETPTAYLAYTGVDSSQRGTPVHDQLMYAAMIRMKLSGAEQVNLHIFQDNIPSAVVHQHYGLRLNGANTTAKEGTFYGFSMPLQADKYLLEAAGKSSTKAQREFICLVPSLSSWAELKTFYDSNSQRIEYLKKPGSPHRPLELAFRILANDAIETNLTQFHPEQNGLFMAGDFSQFPTSLLGKIQDVLKEQSRTLVASALPMS